MKTKTKASKVRVSADFEIRLRYTADRSAISMKVVLGNERAISNVISLPIHEIFSSRQKQLSDALRTFVSNSALHGVPDMDALRKLAAEGYAMFRIMEDGIKKPFLARWNMVFHRRGKSVDLIRQAEDINNLIITFPKGLSFPFALVFCRNPAGIKSWAPENLPVILGHFFDLKFRIRNTIDDSAFDDEGVDVADTYLKSNPEEPIKVVHAINKDYRVKEEIGCWKLDPHMHAELVYSSTRLLNAWHSGAFPRIIHFSCHYDYDVNRGPAYHLTFSKKDHYDQDSLLNYKKPPPAKQALFFLNVCNGGILEDPRVNNIFTDLFPKYALGFITTIYTIQDTHATDMPVEFYEAFVNGGYTINVAFNDSKQHLLREKQKFSAFGYTLWLVDPELVYCALPLNTRKRTLNKKAIKKNEDEKTKKSATISIVSDRPGTLSEPVGKRRRRRGGRV